VLIGIMRNLRRPWKDATPTLLVRFFMSEVGSCALQLTQNDEAGDWLVRDEYTIGRDGEPDGLKRIANILPGERSERLVYQIHAGRARQQDRTTYQLGTDNPKTGEVETWLPDEPIVTSGQAFPFAPLMARNLKAIPDSVCVPVAGGP